MPDAAVTDRVREIVFHAINNCLTSEFGRIKKLVLGGVKRLLTGVREEVTDSNGRLVPEKLQGKPTCELAEECLVDLLLTGFNSMFL